MMVEVRQSSAPRPHDLDGAPDGLTLIRLTAIVEGSEPQLQTPDNAVVARGLKVLRHRLELISRGH